MKFLLINPTAPLPFRLVLPLLYVPDQARGTALLNLGYRLRALRVLKWWNQE